MKVKELLAKLTALDPEQDVLCYCEDERDLPDGYGFRLFDILDVQPTEVVKTRLEDGTPYFKLGKTSLSVSHAIVEIISDF